MAARFVLFAAAVLSATLALGEEVEDAVLVLGKANFDTTIAEHKKVLVEFYAPWCGHCKQLEPEYKQAAAEMKAEGLTTKLAKVDATVEKELGEKYKVEGYPTLLYFEAGKEEPVKYESQRTASGIKKWVKARELPVLTEIPSDGLETFLSGLKPRSFAMVAKVVKKSARAKAYQKLVEERLGMLATDGIANHVTITFGVIYMKKSPDITNDNTTLAMFRPHFEEPDKLILKYEDKWTPDKMTKFAKSALYPVVGTTDDHELYSDELLEKVGKKGVVAVALPEAADANATAELRKKVVEDLTELATTESKYAFITTMRSKDQPDSGELKSVAIRQDSLRYVAKVDEEPATAAEVKKLLDTVKAGKAKPEYKSAAAPADPVDSEGVTVLVGSTFEQYVMDSKKDVFVEFYAPWCGHCQKLTPVWNGLARHAKAQGWADRGVIIAKMDGTENECEEKTEGYPALVLYPAVKSEKKFRQKVTYSGAREFDPLADFVLEQAKNLEGFESASGGGKKQFNQVQREIERRKKKSAEL